MSAAEIDTVVDAMVDVARTHQDWNPNAETRQLWRGVFEALLDSYKLVVVVPIDQVDPIQVDAILDALAGAGGSV